MFHVLVLTAALLGFSTLATAETHDATTMQSSQRFFNYPSAPQKGWAAYLGTNFGYMGSQATDDVQGTQSAFNLIGSYESEMRTWVVDVGYGIQNQVFNKNTYVGERSSASVIELAGRLQLQKRWQLGLVFNSILDRGAVYGGTQPNANFAGFQFLHELGLGENFLGRVGGRLVTNLDVSGSPVNMAAVDFQIGWDGAKRSSSSTSDSNADFYQWSMK